jgi:Fe-S cluster biogenesis protein NfuA
MDTTAVKAGIEKVRGLVQADGGDLTVIDLEPEAGVVHLRLVLEDSSCRECVLPAPHIEEIVLRSLQGVAPEVVRVVVEDPRVGS